MTDFSLKDKVALVTGGSRGIGAAIGQAFAEQGAKIVLVSRKQSELDEAAAAITASGGNAVGIACHVGHAEEIEKLFARIKADYGQLDVLVNNAATNPYFGPFIDTPESMYDKTFEINVKGYFLVSQQAAQMMTAQDNGGSIINVASINGIKPALMQGVYSVTKAGVIALTKSFAKELASAKVRVNALLPGLTDTKFTSVMINNEEMMEKYLMPMIPLHRAAQPDEMSGAVLYLASDASSYTTGATIVVDGGALA